MLHDASFLSHQCYGSGINDTHSTEKSRLFSQSLKPTTLRVDEMQKPRCQATHSSRGYNSRQRRFIPVRIKPRPTMHIEGTGTSGRQCRGTQASCDINHGLFRTWFEVRRCCQMMNVVKAKSMTDRKPTNVAYSCGLEIFSRRTPRTRRKEIARRRF